MNSNPPQNQPTSGSYATTPSAPPRWSNPIEEAHPQMDSNNHDNNSTDDADSSAVYARKRARTMNLGHDGAHLDDVLQQDGVDGGDKEKEKEKVVVVDDDDDDKDDGGLILDQKPSLSDSNVPSYFLGMKRGSSHCHQCKKGNKGRLVRCKTCRSKQFCISCIKNRYPMLEEEDIARACPVCINKCNCMACLRKRVDGSLKTSSKGKMYYMSSPSSRLPSPKECNREQMIGKEQTTEVEDISSQQHTSVKEVRVDDAIAEKHLTEPPLPSPIKHLTEPPLPSPIKHLTEPPLPSPIHSSSQHESTQTPEVGPTPTGPNSIQSLLNLPMEEWVRQSIINGIKTITDIISNYDSTASLLANQARILRSLTILHSIINSACLRTTEISWLSAKIKDFISLAEVVAKMETLVDTKQIKALLSEQANCTGEISGLRVALNEMSHKALELKHEESELLKDEARIRLMRERFLAKKKKLVRDIHEVGLLFNEKIKEKKIIDLRLEQAGIVNLKDVEKENARLKSLINDVISFGKL